MVDELFLLDPKLRREQIIERCGLIHITRQIDRGGRRVTAGLLWILNFQRDLLRVAKCLNLRLLGIFLMDRTGGYLSPQIQSTRLDHWLNLFLGVLLLVDS